MYFMYSNLCITFELNRWSKDLNTDFSLRNCLFGAVKIAKTANPDRYKYSTYDVVFNSRSRFYSQMKVRGRCCFVWS